MRSDDWLTRVWALARESAGDYALVFGTPDEKPPREE